MQRQLDHTDEPKTPIMLASLETTHLNIIHHIRNPLFAHCLHINSTRILWMIFSITKSMAMAFSQVTSLLSGCQDHCCFGRLPCRCHGCFSIHGEWMPLVTKKNMVMIGNETHPHMIHMCFSEGRWFFINNAPQSKCRSR